MKHTAAERLAIIERHLVNYGRLRPHELVYAAQESDHPLHDMFEWDNTKAGHAFRVGQARRFISSVRVERPVGEFTDLSTGEVRVRFEEAPAFVAGRSSRAKRDGYVYTDSVDGEQYLLEELLRYGLEATLRRYRAVLQSDEIDMLDLVRKSVSARLEGLVADEPPGELDPEG